MALLSEKMLWKPGFTWEKYATKTIIWIEEIIDIKDDRK